MTATGTPFDIDPAFVRKYDRPGPRYTSYPPVPNWTTPFGAADYQAALVDAAADTGDVALYVHLPFCPQRCLYCGCNVTVTRRTDRVDDYLDRVEHELRLVTASLGTGKRVTQLHLGGGTPNVLSEEQFLRLHDLLERNFSFAPDAERSIEADPRLVSSRQLQWLYALGFRRLSFGVQDLDPDVQGAIGRVQPAALVAQAVETARSVGFSHLNVDLIYGLPRQTVSSFAKTLDDVLAWRPERIACFGYAHVPWMRKHQRAIQEAELPGADARFALFKMAAERVATLGYEWIGYDHFAVQEDPLTAAHRAGAVHRNFMGYTTMPAAHLIGLGTSSIGEVAGRYVQMDAELPSYLTGIDAGILPVVRGHVLSADDVARRKMIMGLMCNLQLPWTDVIDVEDAKARLAVFEADGLVEFGATALRVTEPGRFFLRNICMEFDAYLGSGSNGPRYSRTV